MCHRARETHLLMARSMPLMAVMTTRSADSSMALDPAAVDADPAQRPGVPKETAPQRHPNAHWAEPSQQDTGIRVFTRANGPGLTPIFGSGQPPARLSGALRGLGYRIPETRASHWITLLLADRVDHWEHRGAGMARGNRADWRAFLRDARGHPLRSGLLIGLLAIVIGRRRGAT